ncbi:MAG: flagellar biosynthetic protein FliO [Planctomycetota bacterium]
MMYRFTALLTFLSLHAFCSSVNARAANTRATNAGTVNPTSSYGILHVPEQTPEPSIVSRQSGFPALARTSDVSADSRLSLSESLQGKGTSGTLITVGSSLAIVLGLFGGLVWAMRRFGNRNHLGGQLPRAAFENLGSTSLDARTRITLIRVGERVVALSQSATETRVISEISDPAEARRLAAHCNSDSQAVFTQTLKSIENERVSPGFVDQPAAVSTTRSRPSRLFATA